MTIRMEEEIKADVPFDYETVARTVILYTLDQQSFPFEAEINLILTDDRGIQEVNREFRSIDRATDVLSFPMIAYDTAGDFSQIEMDGDNFNPDTGEALLGDMVLNMQRVKQQARDYGHSELREYAFLIVHSMLHLLGYDHIEEQDAALMEEQQRAILDGLHILRENG